MGLRSDQGWLPAGHRAAVGRDKVTTQAHICKGSGIHPLFPQPPPHSVPNCVSRRERDKRLRRGRVEGEAAGAEGRAGPARDPAAPGGEPPAAGTRGHPRHPGRPELFLGRTLTRAAARRSSVQAPHCCDPANTPEAGWAPDPDTSRAASAEWELPPGPREPRPCPPTLTSVQGTPRRPLDQSHFLRGSKHTS